MTGLLLLGALFAPEGLSYEDLQAARALERRDYVREPNPEGKRVAFVDIVRDEVFIEEEPFPTFFNYFHWLTKEHVVRRELLLAPGDTWSPARAQESLRNLRELGIFALVTAVPVKTDDPATVGWLVVSRDLWSLRLETGFQFTGSTIDSLSLQLTERNLFGRNKRATLRYGLGVFTHSAGATYFDHRLVGEPLSLLVSGDVLIERETGAADGFVGTVSVARPFYDLRQRWGFSVDVNTDVRTARIASGADLLLFCTGERDEGGECQDGVEIPAEWDQAFYAATARARHQIPGDFVHRLSGGVGISGLEATADLDAYDDADAEVFRERILPTTRRSVFPLVGWGAFDNRFRRFEDLSAFGVSEDMRLGLSVAAGLSAPLSVFGSTRDGVVPSGAISWTDDFAGDGVYETAVGVDARFEDDAWVTRRMLLRLRVASPRFLLGRSVLRADWIERGGRDSDRASVSIGGDNGLRGYVSSAFTGFGASRVRANYELRSPPLVLSYLHLGLVSFLDVGVLYDTADDIIRTPTGELDEGDAFVRLGTGLGVRVLIPQFNRTVFRLDVGVPVDGSGFAILLSGGSAQAFPFTDLEDAQFLDSTVGGLSNPP